MGHNANQIIVVHGGVFLFPQQEMYLSEAAAGSVNEKAARRLTQRDAALPLWGLSSVRKSYFFQTVRPKKSGHLFQNEGGNLSCFLNFNESAFTECCFFLL